MMLVLKVNGLPIAPNCQSKLQLGKSYIKTVVEFRLGTSHFKLRDHEDRLISDISAQGVTIKAKLKSEGIVVPVSDAPSFCLFLNASIPNAPLAIPPNIHPVIVRS